MKEKKKKPLKWSMIGMLIVGWLLPLMLIAFAMLYFVSSMLSAQINKTVVSSTDKAVEICELQLDDIVTASKNASYLPVIRESYAVYKETGNRQTLYSEVTNFLNQQYKYNTSMLCSMLFFMEEPDQIYFTYNTYRDNNSGNSGYKRVTFFRNNVLDKVLEESESLDTGTKLLLENGHLYLIRNMVDSSFTPYAMLVMELSPAFIFDSLESVWGGTDYQVYVDGQPVLSEEEEKTYPIIFEDGRDMAQSVYEEAGKNSFSYKDIRWNRQNLTFVVSLNSATLIDDLYMLRYVFAFVMVFLIPLIILIFRFFHVKVTKPVKELVNAAETITGGKYGHQVESDADSDEFAYLNRTFNAMSLELKYQFERIFKEELELRDATIMALQSQINPHFLNNTLEIINWEARMCGAESVSGMIEALGTMLAATMNREQRRFVTLAEEMSYVDAYLYIISRRFGSRFQVQRDIDESLLDIEVPLLIIQPIVENAVVHGVEEHKEGMVGITIKADWDKIIIEVKNDGALSEQDKERIAYLLSGGKEERADRHVSLGIRNVNRRIKIIYGKECGLTIQSDEENCTISRIIVKMQHESNKSQ